MLQGLAGLLWEIPNIEPKRPDVIVPLDYGTSNDDLALATYDAFALAITEARSYQYSIVLYGNSSHCFPGSEKFEERLKDRMRAARTFPKGRAVCAGAIDNTVVEARVVKEALNHRGSDPREILLICGPIHARSALYIWKSVFPGVRISLVQITYPEYQKNHIFRLQRGFWGWLGANVARHLASRVFGLDWVSRAKHNKVP